MSDLFKNILAPASILAGTIIGAGVFSLPFVFKEVGLATSFFYLAFFCLIFICVYLFYADIIVRTPGEHRFIGYAEMYFGRFGFWSSILIALFQLLLVMAIFLILAPSFLKLIFNGGEFLYPFVFWLISSIAIMFNIRRLAVLEFLIVSGVLAIMAVIFFLGIGNFLHSPISWGIVDISKFLAVGPILFALAGILTLPEFISYFREANIPLSFIRKSLFIGATAPAIAYGAFVLGVLGLSGSVSEDAVSGLIGNAPSYYLALLGILGYLSLTSSYIMVGMNVRKMFNYDLHFPKLLSMVLVIFSPISLYLFGFKNFIGSVSFVGSVFLPLEIIFIIFMWMNANKKLVNPPIFVGRLLKMLIPVLLVIFFAVLLGVVY